MGDSITVTVTLTNTGKLWINWAGAGLSLYLEDGLITRQSSYAPMTAPTYGAMPDFDTGFVPGEAFSFQVIFQTLRSGKANLVGTVSGNVNFSPDVESIWYSESEPVELYVYP